ncbi:MAG: 3-hydroxybutyryl-CoA dehydrogenase [Planctomycetes bacterium]|nr:3-hydroxybutyryl-CoA dehydrogenase [Planctomycetota bacterium]
MTGSAADPRRVGVVGGGTMGNGIAQVLAQAGLEVTLVDVGQEVLDRALATIEKNLARLEKKGRLGPEEVRAARARIRTAMDLEALGESELVVEAVPERFDLKERVFRRLDAVVPPAGILATNTSSISVTRIAACTSRPERVAGMHYMNPVPVMTLVEVVRGQLTSEETLQAVEGLARRAGKTPVRSEDSPGFISNRILLPMINEAVFALQEGVASREAIDEVMKLGMNHPIGPLALADLVGLDVCLDICEVLQRDLGEDKYRPAPLLRRMVAAGLLGRKSGRGFYSYDD